MKILHSILDQQVEVKEKLDTLKTNYSNMIQNNKKKIFIFCLDSYYFQYKMLVVEMENINKARRNSVDAWEDELDAQNIK